MRTDDTAYELAQLNIATLLAPLDSPQLKDFVDNLEPVNALAEASDGFVWRFQTEEGDATAARPMGDDVIINLTVWRDVEALHAFAFKSGHAEFMRRRREWFARMAEAYVVLWWVPKGHRPDPTEALARLEHLREHGPSPVAFGFRNAFAPPDSTAAAASPLDDRCPAD